MSRTLRVSPPPTTGIAGLDSWLGRVADALNALPTISIVSGSPANSGLTASAGALAIDVAPSAASRFWINTSGTTSSWSAIDYR